MIFVCCYAHYVSVNNITISVNFKVELSDNDEIILNNIINNHTGEVINYLVPQKVKIVEEPTPDGTNITQGNYRATSIIIDIPDNIGTYYRDLSFPYYISIISAQWINSIENIGDVAKFIVAPNTIIGAITSGTTSGQTEFYVQDTVIGALNMGYFVSIGDDDLGQVYSIDKNNFKINTELEINKSYNPGTLVKMHIPIVDNFYFNGEGVIQIGNSKIGSSIIPPNTIMRIVYENNNGSAKKFSIFIDYSY